MNLTAHATNEEVRALYEAWRDAPQGDRRAEAAAYQKAARTQDRNDEVCACGVRWRAHFPVGEAGCDHFETKEEEAASAASESWPHGQTVTIGDATARIARSYDDALDAADAANEAAIARYGRNGPAIPRTDPVQEARDLLRGALGELGPLNAALNAAGCEELGPGAANRASVAMARIALALECLSELGR